MIAYKYKIIGVGDSNLGQTEEMTSSTKRNIGEIICDKFLFWEIVEELGAEEL